MKVFLKAAENDVTLGKLAPGETFTTEDVLGVNPNDVLLVSDRREAAEEGGSTLICIRLQDGGLFHVRPATKVQVILTEVHVI